MKPPVLAAAALASIAACAAPARQSVPAAEPGHVLNVGVLLVEGTYNTELVAPIDVLHHVRFHAQPGTNVFTVGRALAPVTTFEGQRVLPDYSLEGAPPIDVLVVPSAEPSKAADRADARLVDWVRERGQRATWVISFCDGAFLLAQAGLLDGRRATTFPGDLDAFRAAFPQVRVQSGVSFVRDGSTITSAGGARSYEAALHLTELVWGADAARAVGQGLCIDWGSPE
jgi:transcriptional regulator GlxA family with amidase domain